MRYEIWGDMLPAVTFTLDGGESVFTQSGGMTWMTENISMDTNMKGGLAKGLGRMFSGESLFMASYTSNAPGEQITFGSSLPGQIKMFEIAPGREIIAQKGAFLCATRGVDVSATVTKSGMGGFFGGEGFILEHFSGQGLVFCEVDGCIKEIDLAPGQIIKVSTGNVAAFESNVTYSAETVKGVKNVFFGGEGLFLTTLRGPGRVWLQTMTASGLAGKISRYIPTER